MAADLNTRIKLVVRVASDQRCTRSDLAAAFVLFCDHYNGTTSQCDPSIGTVAKKIATSRRRTLSALQHLRELGYLEIEVGKGTDRGTGPTNRYIPLFDNMPSRVVTPTSPVTDTSPPELVTPASSGDVHGTEVVTPTSSKPVIKPIREKYAFEGSVIRLTQADLSKWKATYYAIPDLLAELASYDAWFAENETNPKERKRAYHRARQRMNKLHQDRLAQSHRPAKVAAI